MARSKHTLPAGTFKVRMSAYCGMSYDIGTGGYSEAQAIDVVKRFTTKRETRGYDIAQINIKGRKWYTVEIGEPEDSAMVPDDAGVIGVIEETVPAWECHECGDIIAIGESCMSCTAPIEEDTEDVHD